MSGLPLPLRRAVKRYLQDSDARERAGRSTKISDAYRSGGDSQGAIAMSADAGAYLATRLPATYAAVDAALAQVKRRAPDFAPKTLLNAGAGPGTASWAAMETWSGIERVTLLEPNPHFRGAAGTLAGASAHPALHNAAIVAGDMTRLDDRIRFDLVIAAYALTELPDAALPDATARLWRAGAGALVIVEPGTPQGFARMLRRRAPLLGENARIAAPCPGSYPCPIAAPGWCHFSTRLPRSREHMRAKSAVVPYEDEKFSYVAAVHEAVALAVPSPRILARPEGSKIGTRIKLCADGKIAETMVPRRDKAAYKALRRKKWGDPL